MAIGQCIVKNHILAFSIIIIDNNRNFPSSSSSSHHRQPNYIYMQIVIAITRPINFDDWLTSTDLIVMNYLKWLKYRLKSTKRMEMQRIVHTEHRPFPGKFCKRNPTEYLMVYFVTLTIYLSREPVGVLHWRISIEKITQDEPS